jgi:hypothetical protein
MSVRKAIPGTRVSQLRKSASTTAGSAKLIRSFEKGRGLGPSGMLDIDISLHAPFYKAEADDTAASRIISMTLD